MEITPRHIQFIRSQRQWSVEGLASTLGVPIETVESWEAGQSVPEGRLQSRLVQMYEMATPHALDAWAANQRAKADPIGQSGYDASKHAFDAGLTPGAAFMAGNAARAYAEGMTEAEFLMEVTTARRDEYIGELSAVGLWPWE